MHRIWKSFVAAALVCLVTPLLAEATPKRILIIHSFGRDFAPWNEYATQLRDELTKKSHQTIDVYETSLVTARFNDEIVQAEFAKYLRSLSMDQPIDLIVSIGAPAAGFLLKYREQISSSSPVLITAMEQRRIPVGVLKEHDAVVAIKIDFDAVIQNIFKVFPDTGNVAVVIGASPIEKYWAAQVREIFEVYNNRLKFSWFSDLTFEQMLERSANLPPQSAIFFGLLSVDAAGRALESIKAVERLHAVANAPIFSYVDVSFGDGLFGGPMISVSEVSRAAAAATLRILGGQTVNPKVTAIEFSRPKYDWRQMKRWGVSEANLPPGSGVGFKVPTIFEQYRWHLIGVTALFVLQAIFIVALMLSRRRLKREKLEKQQAEEAARNLSGQLISAQEDERARLARELHDDVTQRLALLAIEAGQAERNDPERGRDAEKIRDGLIRLSEDVHALSYQLHPSILDDLGLAEALKAECDRFARLETINVDVNISEFERNVPPTAALGIFRIAQEALRNVVRHANASTAEVILGPVNGGLQLSVRDNGIGFDVKHNRERPSLGLASMQQRTRLLGGELDVKSVPGRGTTVLARIPLEEKLGESLAAITG